MSDFDITIQYTRRYNNKIKQICAPLFNHLGYNGLVYHYISNDGHATSFGSDIPSFEYYYYNNFHLINPFIRHPRYFQTGVLAVNDVKDVAYKSSLRSQEEKYDLGYRFIFFEKLEHGCQGFSFSAPKYVPTPLTDLPLLNRFVEHFKTEAKPILDKILEDQRRIDRLLGPVFDTKPIIPQETKRQAQLAFLQQLGIIHSPEDLALSPREKNCIQLLLLGYSASQIADALTLSKRTVETYLDNLKFKTHCANKLELVTKFREIDQLGLL